MNDAEYVQKAVLEVVDRPLWWHTAGLQQTASGYGSKLTSSKMVRLEGETRLRRVYVTCWSNSGTAWIMLGGRRQYFPAGSLLS